MKIIVSCFMVLSLLTNCTPKTNITGIQNAEILQDINNTIETEITTNEIDIYDIMILRNGLYIMDNNFNFLPIYVNQGTNPFDKSFYDYIKYNDIYLFEKYSGPNTLLFDYLSGYLLEINFSIKSIKFITADKLEITDTEDKKKLINIKNRNTDINIIGKIFDEPEKGERIDRINEYYTRGYDYDRDGTGRFNTYKNYIFLYNMFGKSVLFNLESIKPGYEGAHLHVFYDKKHNIYFICADDLGRLE